MKSPAMVKLKLAVKHWKRTGIVTPKCPKCKRGVMHMEDCCYNSSPPEENYVCGTCGYGETYRGIFTLEAGLIQALEKSPALSKIIDEHASCAGVNLRRRG